MSVDMEPKRSPIVSTWNPGISLLSSHAANVITIMETSAPGMRLEIFGINIIIRREITPTAVVCQSMAEKLRKYAPHLGMNAAGRSFRPRPRKSFIWVEKMVSAIPAVNPTTIG